MSSLATGTRGDIPIDESFRQPLIIHSHEVAGQTQLQFSQHAVDSVETRLLYYVSVGDSVLPPQLQCPSETAEEEMIESLRLHHAHVQVSAPNSNVGKMTAIYIFSFGLSGRP
nr:unnamed protein product [Spirometra erinaceieuropaei]